MSALLDLPHYQKALQPVELALYGESFALRGYEICSFCAYHALRPLLKRKGTGLKFWYPWIEEVQLRPGWLYHSFSTR